MSWLDGPCTTQLFGVACYWIARLAKIGQFLSGMIIVIELVGKERVEAFGERLRDGIGRLAQSGWIQEQERRRAILRGVVAFIFFPFGVIRFLVWLGVGLPERLVSIADTVTSIALLAMIVLNWAGALLTLVDRATRGVARLLERRRLSAIIILAAFVLLVVSFAFDLAVS
jgi:hypothetical protein